LIRILLQSKAGRGPEHIYAIAAIAVIGIVLTTTIQLSEETQRKLFQLVARLQSELGKRVSYDEAIALLIQQTQGTQDARQHFEKLFGALRGKKGVWEDLRQLRKTENQRHERLARSA
jgi:hypothetical protein